MRINNFNKEEILLIKKAISTVESHYDFQNINNYPSYIKSNKIIERLDIKVLLYKIQNLNYNLSKEDIDIMKLGLFLMHDEYNENINNLLLKLDKEES